MKLKKLSKTVRRTIRMYVLVGILPILVFSILYSYNHYQILKHNMDKQLLQSVTQAQSNIDNKLNEVKNYSVHLSNSVQNESLLESGVTSIKTQLSTYRDTSSFLETIVLYDRRDNNIYTPDALIPGDELHVYIGDVNLMTSNFYELVLTGSREQIFPIKNAYPDVCTDSEYIAYNCPIPIYARQTEASAVFVFKITLFSEIITNYIGETDLRIFIYDEFNKNVFARQTSEYPHMADKLSVLKGTGIFPIMVDNREYIAARSISPQFDYKYVVAIPSAEFYKPLQSELRRFIYLFMFIIVLIVFVSAYGAYLQYRPIKNMLTRFGITEINAGDEFDAVIRKYQTIESEQQHLLVQVGNSYGFMKENILNLLLNGRIKSIEFYMQRANMSFYSDRFRVFCFALEGIPDVPELPSEIQFRRGNGYGLVLIEDNIFVLLLNLLETDENESDESYVPQYIHQYLSSGVRYGAGSVVTGKDKINASFIEALAMLKNQTFTNSGAAADNEGVRLLSDSPMFVENLKRGNGDIVRELLEDYLPFFDSCSDKLLLYFCSDAVNCFQKVAAACQCTVNISIEQILTFSDRNELRDRIFSLAEHICKNVETTAGERQAALNNKIIAYVNEHFSDPVLSLTSISTAFSLSGNTVSQIVKKETGQTYIQYLTSVRMSYVKKELRTTERGIHDIIIDAGYQNTASFTRRFKEAEGITPGQYREMSLSE